MNHASARWEPHRDALADRVTISKRQARRIQIDQAVSHLFAVA